ncbi:GCN5-like N-acetyltransferase [Globomyces pollinis-pini]|nr:GCN5-like N-acetyltransferase [Globomyces pollinis-pini]
MYEIILEPACQENSQEIVDLVNQCYRGKTATGWTSEIDILEGDRITKQHLLNQLLNDQYTILVVKNESNRIIACVCLEKKDLETVYLGMISVSPLVQGKGFGSSFLESIENWVIHNWNIRNFTMTVINQRKELIEWYLRRGYVNTNQVIPFPQSFEFGKPKIDGLTFTVLNKIA